jgi:hypothetical protein
VFDDELPEELTAVEAGGDWVQVICPYCGEAVEIHLDPETRGEMVQDCEVCCRPWQLRVERDAEGHASVTADVP